MGNGKIHAYSRRRYLRARKWVPEEAFKQFRDTEEWRKENQISQLYDNIEIADYDQARKLVSAHNGQDTYHFHSHILVPSMDGTQG